MRHLRDKWDRLSGWLSRHLNFYRIHIIVFAVTPVIFAAILWGSENALFKITYIDSLFICMSSMTVTGLATINISPLTGWQQALLFILMCIGHPVAVSWLIVYVRRSYFRRKFGDVIMHRMRTRAEKDGIEVPPELEEQVEAHAEGPWRYHLTRLLRRKRRSKRIGKDAPTPDSQSGSERRAEPHKLSASMIRRVDDAPQLINPSGWISEGHASSHERRYPAEERNSLVVPAKSPERRLDQQVQGTVTSVPAGMEDDISQAYGSVLSDEVTRQPPRSEGERYFPRSQTVEFATPPPVLPHGRKGSFAGGTLGAPSDIVSPIRQSMPRPDVEKPRSSYRGVEIPRTNTVMSARATSTWDPPVRNQDSGFGGFPGPLDVAAKAIRRVLPNLEQKIAQTVTMPRTETLVSHANAGGRPLTPVATRAVPYLRFDTVVGRNSVFHDLTQEKLEELGGVEYRALTALLWIIGAYHIGFQLIVFSIIAPYVSRREWHSVFASQLRFIPPSWFAIFQVVSAYTNTGTSLVDTSMVPFRTAYTMIIPMFIIIIAGNTGFPVFLRFFIWILSKLVPKTSQAYETLHFLLDHPRRCYIYLFPSHQTWFLLTVLVLMVLTDWVSFLVLDIGTPETADIPLGTRFAIGLLQAAAVRAAGFAAVSLNALAPAVKVLYVIMMYVSVYPIALSVRSTNVYEEQSLGIFEAPHHDDEFDLDLNRPRAKVWGHYLIMHTRKQLSFDIWWLGVALWLVCIIERASLVNPDNYGWFNIFTILFEIVSAYGTVGLSLGIPDQNYSFSGACRTLTKLIVILVMLRGRHRGLPVAIDRAVMLRGYDFPDALEQHHPDNATIPRSDADDRSRGRTADLKSVGETNEKLSFRDGYQNGVPGSTPLTASALAVHLMTRPSEGDAEITQKEKGRLDPVPETTRHSRDATQMSHSDDDEIHDLKS